MGTPTAIQVAAIEGSSTASFGRSEREQDTCSPTRVVLHGCGHPLSCHYDVKGGEVVPESDSAWHLGNMNKARKSLSFLVGDEELTEQQELSLVDAICDAMGRYGITLDGVLRHSDVTGADCPSAYADDEKWSALKQKIASRL